MTQDEVMSDFESLTRRQRLELAAKAAGHEAWWDTPRGAKYGRLRIKSGDHWKAWNPPEDDAEAFTLACDLSIQIEHAGPSTGPTNQVNCWPRGRGDCGAVLNYGDDKQAATRLAIFEAAVRLGMTLP